MEISGKTNVSKTWVLNGKRNPGSEQWTGTGIRSKGSPHPIRNIYVYLSGPEER